MVQFPQFPSCSPLIPVTGAGPGTQVSQFPRNLSTGGNWGGIIAAKPQSQLSFKSGSQLGKGRAPR